MSSFSRYIKQAEDYTRITLFERIGKRVELTSAGIGFLDILDNLQESLADFEVKSERLKQAGPDVINIGCAPLAARSIVAPAISEILAANPSIRVRTHVTSSKHPVEQLRTGSLDIVVCDLSHTPDLTNCKFHVFEKKKLSFWARPQHPLQRKSGLKVKNIVEFPIACPGLPRYWREVLTRTLGTEKTALQRVGLIPDIESDDLSFLAEVTKSSDVICCGLYEDYEGHHKSGALREIRVTDKLDWNMCAVRRVDPTFPSLDFAWERIINNGL